MNRTTKLVSTCKAVYTTDFLTFQKK